MLMDLQEYKFQDSNFVNAEYDRVRKEANVEEASRLERQTCCHMSNSDIEFGPRLSSRPYHLRT